MRDQELDAILSREQDIAPSSGFVASVMEAVGQQATTPPPIPFPWLRALPGIAAIAVALGVLLVTAFGVIAREPTAQPTFLELQAVLATTLELAKTIRAGWLALALAISFVCVKLSTHLAATSENR